MRRILRLVSRAAIVAALSSLLAPDSRASDACVPLLYNGHPSSKLDVIFVAQHQYPATGAGSKFASDVDALLQRFYDFPQFAANISRFNFWRVDATVPDDSCEEYVYNPICWDIQKVRDIADNCIDFDWTLDRIIVVFNADSAVYNYGRGDFDQRAAFMPSNAASIMIHEFGHAFADLGDEYDSAFPAQVEPHYVNIASLTPGWTCQDKWGDLIGTNGVGCFQNAGATNWYRPTQNDCIMRISSLDHYCPVCGREVDRLLRNYRDGVTSVRISPPMIALSAPYPNPFSRSTTIRVDVDAPMAVSVRIYDVRGRLVASLREGNVHRGENALVWTGRDARGRDAPSGIYFCRLLAAGRGITRKIVLLR
jgi:hypothetical protein